MYMIQNNISPIRNVGLIGTSIMGQGIAQLAAQAGARVLLQDARPGAAAQAQQQLLALWDTLQKKQKITSEQAADCKARLTVVDGLDAFKNCDLVIEAIVERMDAKQALLRELEAIVAPGTLIASNTSALSITTLATALKHPQRFAGFHFFNPAPLMKVVEIVRGLATDEATCATLAQFAAQLRPHARACAGHAGLPGQPPGPRLCDRGAAHRAGRHCRLRHHRPHPARARWDSSSARSS